MNISRRVGFASTMVVFFVGGCGESAPSPPVSLPPPSSAISAETLPIVSATPQTLPSSVPSANGPMPATDEIGVIFQGTPVFVPTKPLNGSTLPTFEKDFIAAGCSPAKGELDCSKALKTTSYARIHASKELSNLTPATPIGEWWEGALVFQPPAHAPVADIRDSRGMIQLHMTFLIPEGKNLEIIRSRADFIKRFAPAESPEEALAFAVAFTGASPDYSPRYVSGFHYYSGQIEGTRVTEDGDAYRVTLFDQQVFGCGIKPLSELEIKVTKAGEVTTLSSKPLYADPTSAGMCVD
jgi:hypothetical protein